MATAIKGQTKPYYAHPLALVESTRIGAGTRVWAYAHVMKGAVIGRDCNVGDHAFVESGARVGHGVTIKNGVAVWEGVALGDFSFVGPNAVFTNDLRPRSPRFPGGRRRYATKAWLGKTRIGKGASIGANATIVCGHSVGEFAMIGAGAVVASDVPPHTLMLGVPARPAGYVCECGETLRFSHARSAASVPALKGRPTSLKYAARCAACKLRYTLVRGRVTRSGAR